jgi:hypothetical protein
LASASPLPRVTPTCGLSLKSAGWGGELDAHSFYIDHQGGHVYIGAHPTNRFQVQENLGTLTKVSIATGQSRPTYSLYRQGGRPEMYLLIRYPVGIVVEAVLLANGKDRLRIAAAGFPDAIELRRSGQQWLTADREPVEFEFLMSNTHQAVGVSSPKQLSVARAAGSAAI